MKYAVIASGGKQYRVSEGDIIDVENLSIDEKKPVSFDTVLLYVVDGKITFGTPHVKGIAVLGESLGVQKGKKIRVAKFKAKVRYRRVMGHRQSLTRVKITKLGVNDQATSKKEEKPHKEEANQKREKESIH